MDDDDTYRTQLGDILQAKYPESVVTTAEGNANAEEARQMLESLQGPNPRDNPGNIVSRPLRGLADIVPRVPESTTPTEELHGGNQIRGSFARHLANLPLGIPRALFESTARWLQGNPGPGEVALPPTLPGLRTAAGKSMGLGPEAAAERAAAREREGEPGILPPGESRPRVFPSNPVAGVPELNDWDAIKGTANPAPWQGSTYDLPPGNVNRRPELDPAKLPHNLNMVGDTTREVLNAAKPLQQRMRDQHGFTLMQPGLPADPMELEHALGKLETATRHLDMAPGEPATYPAYGIYFDKPGSQLGRFEDGYGGTSGIRVPTDVDPRELTQFLWNLRRPGEPLPPPPRNFQVIQGGLLADQARGLGLRAAFRVGDRTFTGENHGVAYDNAVKELGGPNEVSRLVMNDMRGGNDRWGAADGFIDDKGNWYSRQDALALVKKQGLKTTADSRFGLTSEDLADIKERNPPPVKYDPAEIEALYKELFANTKKGSVLGAIIEGSLPMDQASRLARAREQGFDTDRMWYRGRANPENPEKIDPSRAGKIFGDRAGAFLTEMPEMAGEYARHHASHNTLERLRQEDMARQADYEAKPLSLRERMFGRPAFDPYGSPEDIAARKNADYMEGANIVPAYVKPGKQATVDLAAPENRGVNVRAKLLELKKAGYDTAIVKNSDDALGGLRRPDGRYPDEMVLFKEGQARSPWAAYDPSKIGDPHLLSANTKKGSIPGVLFDAERPYGTDINPRDRQVEQGKEDLRALHPLDTMEYTNQPIPTQGPNPDVQKLIDAIRFARGLRNFDELEPPTHTRKDNWEVDKKKLNADGGAILKKYYGGGEIPSDKPDPNLGNLPLRQELRRSGMGHEPDPLADFNDIFLKRRAPSQPLPQPRAVGGPNKSAAILDGMTKMLDLYHMADGGNAKSDWLGNIMNKLVWDHAQDDLGDIDAMAPPGGRPIGTRETKYFVDRRDEPLPPFGDRWKTQKWMLGRALDPPVVTAEDQKKAQDLIDKSGFKWSDYALPTPGHAKGGKIEAPEKPHAIVHITKITGHMPHASPEAIQDLVRQMIDMSDLGWTGELLKGSKEDER